MKGLAFSASNISGTNDVSGDINRSSSHIQDSINPDNQHNPGWRQGT